MRRRSVAVGVVSVALLVAFVDVGHPARIAPSFSLARSAAPVRPSFAKPKRYPVLARTYAVAIGDLNGDGKPDLVTTIDGNAVSNYYVLVLLNQGRSGFRSRRAYRIGEWPAVSVALGDMNGDRKPDLATANMLGNAVSVLMNRGGGRFAARKDYEDAAWPRDIASADLNGDGSADLATASTNDPGDRLWNRVSIFISKGDGTFEDRVDYRPGRHPVSIAAADLNGDGKVDLATANLSDSVSVFLNRGDGTFKDRVDYRAGSGPRSIAVGDLNGDGRPDLVTANDNCCRPGQVDYVTGASVLLGKGDGTFRAKLDYVAPHAARNGSLQFISVAVGDLNGDGKDDVAIGGDPRTVSVLVSRGDGRFLPRLDYHPGAVGGPRVLAFGDLNGDRKPDLVAAEFASVMAFLNTTKR